jgi:hypothetical protein
VRAAHLERHRVGAALEEEGQPGARDEPIGDRLGTEVRGLGAPEGDAAAVVTRRLESHPRVVEIHDRGRVAAKNREQLALRRRDLVERGEELEVHGPDVGHETDVRIGEAREEGDLAGPVHAHLDDGHLRVLGTGEEGQRHAEFVVEVADRAVDAMARGEPRGDELLRRRLSGAAGQRDDLRVIPLPREGPAPRQGERPHRPHGSRRGEGTVPSGSRETTASAAPGCAPRR